LSPSADPEYLKKIIAESRTKEESAAEIAEKKAKKQQ